MSYERCIYESVDDSSLSLPISRKLMKKVIQVIYKGLNKMKFFKFV